MQNSKTFLMDGGVLRLDAGTNIVSSPLYCSPRGYLQVWTQNRAALNIGSNNCSE
jgi:hypothetical protein